MTKYHTLTCFAVEARGAVACELFVSILARSTILAWITHTLVKRGSIFNKMVYNYSLGMLYLRWIRYFIKCYLIEKRLHTYRCKEDSWNIEEILQGCDMERLYFKTSTFYIKHNNHLFRTKIQPTCADIHSGNFRECWHMFHHLNTMETETTRTHLCLSKQ